MTGIEDLDISDMGPLPKADHRAHLIRRLKNVIEDTATGTAKELGLTSAEMLLALADAQSFILGQMVATERRRGCSSSNSNSGDNTP